jgi:hypothetical protein
MVWAPQVMGKCLCPYLCKAQPLSWAQFVATWTQSAFIASYSLPQTNSVALSPHENYTDWATVTCWQNLVPTFVDRGVSCGQRGGSPTTVNLNFLDRSCYFLSISSSFILTRAEGTPSETHFYSEYLVRPGIEPATSGLAVRKSDY